MWCFWCSGGGRVVVLVVVGIFVAMVLVDVGCGNASVETVKRVFSCSGIIYLCFK